MSDDPIELPPVSEWLIPARKDREIAIESTARPYGPDLFEQAYFEEAAEIDPKAYRAMFECEPLPTIGSVAYGELKDGQCHWPTRLDCSTQLYCGDTAVPRKPYCAAHCSTARDRSKDPKHKYTAKKRGKLTNW